MKFDEQYTGIMQNLLFERQGSIVLYPGGFKPPHKGHFEALKYLIHKFDAQLAVVLIGKPCRDTVTCQQSQAIWNIYKENIDIPVETQIAEVSPVRSVYEYAENNINEVLIVGAGEEDMSRYKYFETNKDKFPNVVVTSVPPQFGRISGSETRKNLSDTNWIPDVALDHVDKIHSILGL